MERETAAAGYPALTAAKAHETRNRNRKWFDMLKTSPATFGQASPVGIAAVLLLALSSAAIASPHAGTCRAYATQAVAQNEDNLAKGCGFAGPRWQSDHDAHYRWCVGGGWMFDGHKNEANARADELSRCKPKPSNEGFCKDYAQTAVRQGTENKQRQCGFSGPRWGIDIDPHYQWCKVADPNSARDEQAARAQGLAGCTSAKEEDNQVYCSQHARLAVTEFNESNQRGCNLTGREWHGNYQSHKDWCLRHGRDAAGKLHDSRMHALANCGPKAPANAGYQLFFDGKLVSGPDAQHYTLAQAKENCAWNKRTKPAINVLCAFNGQLIDSP